MNQLKTIFPELEEREVNLALGFLRLENPARQERRLKRDGGNIAWARGVLERFWRNVQTNVDDDCWTWKPARSPNTIYGLFRPAHRRVCQAHRFSYAIHFGDPKEAFVLHRCDNPKCVNPNHLFLGSQMDNMMDRMAKGKYQRGESITWHKLNEKTIPEIKRLASEGVTHQRIANRFGVAKPTIQDVLAGRTWRHI